MLHSLGREFGATTGRKRRCGWSTPWQTRYARMINGIDELAITNLDGLDRVDPIRVCIAYRLNGKRLNVPPCDAGQAGQLRTNLYGRARLERTYSFCSKLFAASCCGEKICQIHFRN